MLGEVEQAMARELSTSMAAGTCSPRAGCLARSWATTGTILVSQSVSYFTVPPAALAPPHRLSILNRLDLTNFVQRRYPKQGVA